MTRQVPYKILDSNDLVAYNVVKLNMRPDSVNLQRRLCAASARILSPTITNSRDFFSPVPMIPQQKIRVSGIRKRVTLSPCCFPRSSDSFKTPEHQTVTLLPSSVKLENYIHKHSNIHKNCKLRKSLPNYINNLCPKKLNYSPTPNESNRNRLRLLLERNVYWMPNDAINVYINIYKRCWHTDPAKRPLCAVVLLELSHIINPSTKY